MLFVAASYSGACNTTHAAAAGNVHICSAGATVTSVWNGSSAPMTRESTSPWIAGPHTLTTKHSEAHFSSEYRWLEHRLEELAEEEALVGTFEALT